MILGRSTVQWTGLITAAGGLAQVLAVSLIPGIDAALVAIIIGASVTFLGVFVAFLGNTATTPVKDPQLQAGTLVRVTDEAGVVIGHEPVPVPSPPGAATEGTVPNETTGT